MIDSTCEGFGRSDLHIISDFLLPVFEDSLEETWKDENIVHLIRIVRSTRPDDPDSCLFRDFWHDLRGRIRHSKYDSVRCHRASHIEGESSCGRDTDKDISTDDRISKGSYDIFSVREFEEFLFRDIEPLSTTMDNPFRITSDKVLDSIEVEELRDSDSRGTSTIEDNLDILFFLTSHFECIDEACEDDDRGTVLIIMHDGDIEFRLQSFFDLETPRSGDILEVDPTESVGNIFDRRDKGFDILCPDDNREGIHSSKFPKKDTLPFHDGHTRLVSEISESEYGRSI